MGKLIAALVLFAGASYAQSPLTGTWKLDTAKTKYNTGAPPKDLTLVIEGKGDNLEITANGTAADGSPMALKYTIPEKGGAGQVQQSTIYDGVTSKRVSAYEYDNTYMKNGKEVTTRHTVVSKDGKTLRSTAKGVNTQGRPISGTDVFEKR
jgi:hypothetical protein